LKSITTRTLILSEIQEQDLKTLFTWRNSDSFIKFCTVRKKSVNFDEFYQELKRDFERDRYSQMIIRLKRSNAPIGTVYCYNLNREHGFAFVTIFLEDQFQRKGFGIEAFGSFLCWLFDSLPELYKVYAEVYEINEHSISCLTRAGFEIEGRFKEHTVLNCKRCDLMRLAFYRRQLTDGRLRFAKILGTV
jgi:RimJ/RimL family protein N-acetyltransferase